MNYYACKFKRERKRNPMHWMIQPDATGMCRLVYIGPKRDTQKRH